MLQQAQNPLMYPYYPEINMGGHPTFVDLMAPYPESSHQSPLCYHEGEAIQHLLKQ